MITLIAARDRNGAIGKDNTIPWKAPEDLKFFMTETLGGAVVMGRHTWESLPIKPLKNRLNIVVSSRGVNHDHVVGSVGEAIALARAEGRLRIYATGGAGIYEAMLPLADRLLLTDVETEVEGADTWFPAFDPSDWREVARTVLREAGPRCEVVERLR
ncbi:dihydrofolate reductase [Celeribacter indicus]|uniref:Dihydrofolate reductase n=1 Tax=Celeribacter indicus TaxID=1208324 RepID=A0A0B5E5I2_9RHOB|nr:dihydrofolate reductase [Celeribacter indicus]AJE48256.1 dihydrofolate reductase FolA [Celeribacter indicus]SDW70836.1 dihydrofolate reductase [Celeribacter indicus]